jgi:hypothetical protein
MTKEGREWFGTRCSFRHFDFVIRHFLVSLSSRDGADAPPRRSVKDSAVKHPPTRPTQ